MLGRSLKRPSPAMVIASFALLVALGGTSVAAVSVVLPRNSVGNAQIKKDSVTSIKVKDGSLLKRDFRSGQLPRGPVGPAGAAGLPGAAGASGPSGASGPAGPSDAYVKMVAPAIVIPTALTTLASLTIPQAGKYVATAKVNVFTSAAAVAACVLYAGTDHDQNTTTASTANHTTPSTSILAHEFTAAGTFELKCSSSVAGSSAEDVVITAVKVGTLTAS